MDLNETLFKRTLVKAHRDQDEEKSLAAEELSVTKEQNGYALWYRGRDIYQPRIIAWSRFEKFDLIAYAVNINLGQARMLADTASVNHKVQSLDTLSFDPVPEKK
jgi:hypothetical protein